MVPRDSLAAMHFSEDFHAELFAAEPDVMSPVEMAFDENGKVYVAEMMDYPEDPPAGKPARSRIRVLDNPNGDGRSWRSSIFAENVLAVSGFMPWKGGLIVTSAPDILFLKDTDGDGKADVRQVLYTGLPESEPGGSHHQSAARRRQLDLLLQHRLRRPHHFAGPPGDAAGSGARHGFPFRPDQRTGRTGFGTGAVRLHDGRLRSSLHHPEHDSHPARRRAHEISGARSAAGGSRGGAGHFRSRPAFGADVSADRTAATGASSAPHCASSATTRTRSNVTEQVSGWFTAASGGTIYNGDAFPKEYVGSVFTGDVSGNLIHRDIIRPDGATFAAQRAMEKVEFLASTDVWFRPCNFTNAPDGNLYVTDIYRQVIETPESIPEEIRKKIDFFNGDTLGRIYRIVPNHPLRQGNLKPNLGAASSAELVKQLANPNGWHRQTAHRLLLERQDRSVIPDAEDDGGAAARLPRLACTPCGCCALASALQASDVERATKDADPRIREHALQLSESFLASRRRLRDALIALSRRRRMRTSVFRPRSRWASGRTARARRRSRKLAHRDSADPWFRIAILSSVARCRGAILSHGAGEGRDLDGPAASDRGLGNDRRAAESGGDCAMVCGASEAHAAGKVPGRTDARPATGTRAEPAGSRCRPDIRATAFFRTARRCSAPHGKRRAISCWAR